MSLDKYLGIGLISLGAVAITASYGLTVYEIKQYNNSSSLRHRNEHADKIKTYLIAGIPIGDMLSLAGLIILEETKKRDDSSSLMVRGHERIA